MLLLLLCLLVAAAAAAPCSSSASSESEEYDYECLHSSGLSEEDLQASTDLPEGKLLCYTKCIFEKQGYIREDGTLDVDAIETSLDGSESYSEEIDFECLRSVPKVLTCQDVLYLQECVHSSESNE